MVANELSGSYGVEYEDDRLMISYTVWSRRK
jgi:hypothetical protein